MFRRSLLSAVGLGAGAFAAVRTREAFAHCQVPCGIYDDSGRIKQLKEDATTIRKAVAEIQKLSGESPTTAQTWNQISRWVATKEQHASHIILFDALRS
jgi:nickel superoxide dismutase